MVMLPKMNINNEPSVSDFLALFPGHHVFYWDNHEKGGHGQIGMDSNSKSILATLDNYNSRGYSIYMTMSEIVKGDRRTKADFVRACAIGLDDDQGKCDPMLFPIQPNITVHTSPGKRQFFWLTTTSDKDLLEAVNRSVSTNYHGDPSFGDCTRVCRLPGFKNHKYDIAPDVTFEIHSTMPYAWSQIESAFPPEYEEIKHPNGGRTVNGRASLDIGEATNSIITGDEVYPSCLRLSASFIAQGMNPKAVHSVLSGILNSSTASKERIDNARSKLWELIDTATERYAIKINASRQDTELGSIVTKLKWPPGRLGLVAKHVNRSMPYPCPEIAIVTAMHVVSVLGGGCYHYRGASVSRKRTVLALNGRGKQTISDYLYYVLDNIPINMDLRSLFSTSDSFTAQNNHLDLMEHKTRSLIVNEAGSANATKAGDQHSKTAYQLQGLAIKIGGAPLSITEKARNKNNEATVPVQDAVIVMLEESTPETYMEGFKSSKALDSGAAARTETIFTGVEEYYNDDHYLNKEIPDDIMKLFTALVQQYMSADVMDGTVEENISARHIDVDFSEVEPLLLQMAHENVELRKKAGTDNNQRAQIVRAREKYLGTCIILALADSCDVNSLEPKRPKVTMEHLQYAMAYHTELDRAFMANLQDGVFSSNISQCLRDFEIAVRRIGSTTFGEEHYRSDGLISVGWCTRVLGERSSFKNLKSEFKNKLPREISKVILQQACDDKLIQPSAKADLYINLMRGK